MKMRLSFPLQIFLTVIISFLISFYFIYQNFSGMTIISILIGCFLSVINVLAGYFIVSYSFKKSNKIFLKAVIGGILGRLFFIGAIMVILIKFFNIEIIGFIISMLFYYFIFLSLEINFLHKKLTKSSLKVTTL